MYVDIDILKNGNIIAVSLRMGFCVGDGKLGALFHYLAQRTRQFQPSCSAGHCLHLDGQYLAAHAGPRKAIGHAHGVLTAEKSRFHAFWPQNLFQVFITYRKRLHLSRRDALGALAQQFGDGALQVAHTRFLRISVDQAVQRGVRQLHTAFQARGSELLGQQVTLGDLELFHARIAGKLNNIHTVQQRTRNGIRSIGRGDKQHIAQVKRDIQIVILERDVLLRVQRFQQGGGRVAPKIAGHFVHLVQQEQRIRALCREDGADDLAGHRPDIGAPMAADLGLIPHAAQRHSRILAAQAFSDGPCNGRFTHARRADQANDLSFDFGRQLAHGQNLKDAFLHLFQAVMLLIQKRSSLIDVQIILGTRIPRKIQTCVQISADDRSLLGIALHFEHAVRFLEQFLPRLFGQLCFFDLRLVFLSLLAGVVEIVQLVGNRPHLLTQVIIPLVFVHLLVDLALDVLFNVQYLRLPAQDLQQLFQAAGHSALIEQRLFVGIFQQQVCRDIITQQCCILIGDDGIHHVFGKARVQRKIFLKGFFHTAHQRLHACGIDRFCPAQRGGLGRRQQKTPA